MGDLNYRMNMEAAEVFETLAQVQETPSAWEKLHANEQLIHCMAIGEAFRGFREADRPCFPPTYR